MNVKIKTILALMMVMVLLGAAMNAEAFRGGGSHHGGTHYGAFYGGHGGSHYPGPYYGPYAGPRYWGHSHNYWGPSWGVDVYLPPVDIYYPAPPVMYVPGTTIEVAPDCAYSTYGCPPLRPYYP